MVTELSTEERLGMYGEANRKAISDNEIILSFEEVDGYIEAERDGIRFKASDFGTLPESGETWLCHNTGYVIDGHTLVILKDRISVAEPKRAIPADEKSETPVSSEEEIEALKQENHRLHLVVELLEERVSSLLGELKPLQKKNIQEMEYKISFLEGMVNRLLREKEGLNGTDDSPCGDDGEVEASVEGSTIHCNAFREGYYTVRVGIRTGTLTFIPDVDGEFFCGEGCADIASLTMLADAMSIGSVTAIVDDGVVSVSI